MAVRRISELDQLTNINEEYLDSLIDASTSNGTNVKYNTDIDSGFFKYIFEVSEYTEEIDGAPSYYISKQISYPYLSKILTYPITKSIDNMVSVDTVFYGDKIFNGDVTINGYLSSANISTLNITGTNANISNIFGTNANISNIFGTNANISNISCTNLTAANDIKCKTLSAKGDITCNNMYGTAMSARWADLAEMYESDYDYEPGTLVKFGGQKEITIAEHDVNGVITSAPGLVLNGGKQEHKIMKGIALIGRVPVKVIGEIQKFDNITLSKQYPGYATKALTHDKVIGKALETNYSTECKLVECVVKMTF